MRVRSTILGSLILGLLISTAALGENLAAPASTAQTNTAAAADPLLQLLVAKGVLNAEDTKSLVGTQSEQRSKLLELLLQKGILSVSDYDKLATPVQGAAFTEASGPHVINAVMQSSSSNAQSQRGPTGTPPVTATPAGILAVAPLRVLPIDVPKQAGMIPDIRLGSGANMKIYGFFKASAISDTASSGGATFGSQDWPLPLLLGDTATAIPTANGQVHLKARSFRIGMQTEWVPKNSDFTITGKVEGDFEGDYTDVSNRNISSVRSNQFSLRLAYMRLDHKIGDLPWFAEFGQDWSLISSTLPNLFETTGLGVGMGTLYERIPQFRTGIQFHAGDLKIQPEVAIVLSSQGSSGLTTDQHLRFGDSVGAESDQPGVEARVVFQFPLSHEWKGVAPAQIIFSGHHSRMNEIIPHATQLLTTCTTLPCTPFTSATVPNVGFSQTTIIGSDCANPAGCSLASFFPIGTQDGNAQNLWTAELQVPTPWVTLAVKYYRGSDMRFFFGSQLNDVYSNLNGLFEVGNGVSEAGRAILFGCLGGAKDPVLANTFDCPTTSPVQSAILQPVAGSGGFAELSFPLSRIFNANPEGHNAGWILHMQYGTDRAKYSDAQHGNHLGRTDLDTASLTYRLNKWVTFVHEASYIVTDTANDQSASGFTPHYLLFAGKPVRQAHNWRNEFGPVFTF